MTAGTLIQAENISSSTETRRFRPDIQGMRAVAVLSVVLYHAGVPLLTGGYVGVDIFFVISGFLITGLLFRELEATGRVSVAHFYSRRFKRLLPPAFMVILATLLFGRSVLPRDQLLSLTSDAFWAAVYGINYHLALEGIHYQSAATPSALQHFWSLAVEEQFYLVWPALLLIVGLVVARRWRRPAVTTLLALVFVASLIVSIRTTQTNVPMAYFSLQSRAWELAAGGLLAMATPLMLRLPDVALRWLGWAGLGAIGLALFLYDDATPFPGYTALLPVLGAVAVIAAGTRLVSGSVETRLLDLRSVQYIGRSSYAWYLWHWPMLVLLPVWLGRELVLWERLEVVFISYWFAVLTYFLENAAARSPWNHRRWLATGAAGSVLIIAATSLVTILMPSLQGRGAAAAVTQLRSPDPDGLDRSLARSLQTTAVPANLTPTLVNASKDYPWEPIGCSAGLAQTVPHDCVFGDPKGLKTAVLIGDSHADQWLNALSTDAKARGWKLISMTKAACPVADLLVWNNDLKRPYTECQKFKAAAWPQIKAMKPDLIIASEADAVGASTVKASTWATSTVQQMRTLAGPKTKLVFLGDTPYMPAAANGCVEKHMDDVRACIYPINFNPVWTQFYRTMQATVTKNGIGYVDTRAFFCNRYVCPAVVDNMLTHRDQGHATRTYANWLAPMLAPIFEEGPRS